MADREEKLNPKEQRDETSVEQDASRDNTTEQTPKPDKLDTKELGKIIGGGITVMSW